VVRLAAGQKLASWLQGPVDPCCGSQTSLGGSQGSSRHCHDIQGSESSPWFGDMVTRTARSIGESPLAEDPLFSPGTTVGLWAQASPAKSRGSRLQAPGREPASSEVEMHRRRRHRTPGVSGRRWLHNSIHQLGGRKVRYRVFAPSSAHVARLSPR
jgi:hypothetical protein